MHLDLDSRFHAECPGHVIPIGRALSLFRRIEPAIHEFLQQRVIEGQLLELAAAQTVGPGIADVGDRHLVVVEHAGNDRRAHALAVRLALCRLENDLVGPVYRVPQHN